MMQVLVFSSQAQAISHCIYTFLDVFKRNGRDEDFLLTLVTRQGIKIHVKMLSFLNNMKNESTVSDPVCRLLDYLFTKAPKLTFEINPRAAHS